MGARRDVIGKSVAKRDWPETLNGRTPHLHDLARLHARGWKRLG